jgi:hypothetical protein
MSSKHARRRGRAGPARTAARGLVALAAALGLVGVAASAASASPANNISTLVLTGDNSPYVIPPGGVTVDQLVFDGGTIDGPGTVTIPAGGSVTVESGQEGWLDDGARLLNQGAGSVPASSDLFLVGSSEIENTGTFSLATGALVSADDGSADQFLNDATGTVSYDGLTQSQTATVAVAFQNLGTVQAQGGTFDFTGGTPTTLADTGTYQVSSGAVLESDASSPAQTLGSGATETGSGTFELAGNVDVPTVTTPPTVANLTFDSGTLIGPGQLDVAPSGTLGAVAGAEGWLTGGAHLLNQGTGSLPAGDLILLLASSELENAGSLSLGTNAELAPDDGSSNEVVNDHGATLSYDGLSSAQSATQAVPMINRGTVAAQGGTLVLSGGTPTGQADTGVMSVSPGAVLQSDAGGTEPQILGSGATETGTGSFQLVGTLEVPGGGTAPQLNQLTFAGGSLEGPGTAVVHAGGTLTVPTGNQGFVEGGAHLVNKGTASMAASTDLLLTGGSVLENAGAFTLGLGATVAPDDGLTETFRNDAAGTVTFTAPVKTDSASIGVSVTNAGTLRVGGGQLDLGSLSNTGTLSVTLSGNDAGQAAVSGRATLGGTLALVTKSGYSPKTGATFPVLTATSVVHTFATVTGTPGGGRTYRPVYSAGGVTIQVAQAPAFTSAAAATFTHGVKGSFTVTTTGTPAATVSLTGGTLPAGVTLGKSSAGKAVLSGTATTPGTYPVTLTASNGVAPAATQDFTLTVS